MTASQRAERAVQKESSDTIAAVKATIEAAKERLRPSFHPQDIRSRVVCPPISDQAVKMATNAKTSRSNFGVMRESSLILRWRSRVNLKTVAKRQSLSLSSRFPRAFLREAGSAADGPVSAVS